ncbi:MAG TPA: CAP domain-containing protein [Mycobacteriales bacterium]|nr:CAP domain-containing protein [Mycobacteriales bacterium]
MPNRTARPLATAVTMLLLALGALVGGASPAAAEGSSDSTMLSLLNHERTSRGLAALQSASDLVQVAAAHSAEMAGRNSLYHNSTLSSDVKGWVSLAENVGYGSTAEGIHKALMNSAGHRANILGTFSQIGVATVRDGSGRLWVTQVFRLPDATTTNATGSSPIGTVDVVRQEFGVVRVAGWALDKDTSSSIAVHVYGDGKPLRGVTANLDRPDIGKLFGKGDAHGYNTTVALPEGVRTVCAYGINAAGTGGRSALLGCRRVGVRHTPIGRLDAVSPQRDAVVVGGWTLDPDTADSTYVHVYVDGRPVRAISANRDRGDIARAFPGYGTKHGYTAAVPAATGWRTVCVYAVNVSGTAGGSVRLGCSRLWVH